ncbi:MAG: 2-phospho-L-lactate guanylyltransferase [Novosphingobium sp.]|nr:2-phospho-L-lactate guanylyltransferase [Novosphingobium sp.]
MSCWALIPVKSPAAAKRRLAGALDEASRAALVRRMLERVVLAAQSARGIDRVCLIGFSRHGLDESVPLLAEPGKGLNAAIAAGLASAASDGATRAVCIAADLPLIATQDLELLALAPDGAIAIAPDRHGTGTNALSLPLPEAGEFHFAFGPDSCARHHLEAARLGLPLEEIHSLGLARDVDVPEDLPDALALLQG